MPLTDAQWARIEPLLPDRTLRRGGRWRDHREVIDAIAWKPQTVVDTSPATVLLREANPLRSRLELPSTARHTSSATPSNAASTA
ncbi:transposase [Streptomyces sp. ME01-18a]|uniref:transposase n=1 Tax=Streptomyces sp. ME01-18a TaxID=3028669 RepID=UPI0039F70E1F